VWGVVVEMGDGGEGAVLGVSIFFFHVDCAVWRNMS